MLDGILQTYGMNQSTYECPQCYDPVTGRKFWGELFELLTAHEHAYLRLIWHDCE